MLITALLPIRSRGYREPHEKVGSQSLAERISLIQTGNVLILRVTRYPTALLSAELTVINFKQTATVLLRNLVCSTGTICNILRK